MILRRASGPAAKSAPPLLRRRAARRAPAREPSSRPAPCLGPGTSAGCVSYVSYEGGAPSAYGGSAVLVAARRPPRAAR